MKFKCRPSREEREKAKFEAEKEWHKIFLWRPKRMEDGFVIGFVKLKQSDSKR